MDSPAPVAFPTCRGSNPATTKAGILIRRTSYTSGVEHPTRRCLGCPSKTANPAGRRPPHVAQFPAGVSLADDTDAGARGEHGVRIELELPRERVLLLDFETRHCVLSRWHLSRSWWESREWTRKTKGLDQFRAPLTPPLEAELQASWQRVFDFSFLKHSKLWGPLGKIQGVTEYILLDEVRSVTKFAAR